LLPFDAVYLTEQVTPLFRYLGSRYADLVGSEYLGEKLPRGATDSRGVRNEDLTRLTFPDESFDVLLSFDCFEHMPDFVAGMCEVARVLKPGGRLLVLDFGKPDFLPWRWIYYQYLERICPLFGRIFCGDGDTHGYILDSLKAYPAQHGVDAALRELGYLETRIQSFLGGTMTLNIGQRR
jgi:ubiquinone/menaquinone biosynthesis C-methylase UbiE